MVLRINFTVIYPNQFIQSPLYKFHSQKNAVFQQGTVNTQSKIPAIYILSKKALNVLKLQHNYLTRKNGNLPKSKNIPRL